MLRIATWNLERPRRGSVRKIPYILGRIHDINADIWVLTETNQVIDLSATHTAITSSPPAPYHTPGENWTTIWSRFPARPLATYDSTVAVSADVEMPGAPLVVYGTVLPYHADRVSTGEATLWSEHYRVLPLHSRDWQQLRERRPKHRFCVAGDLNQSRDGRRWPPGGEWYGTAKGRKLLGEALTDAKLACVTEEDFVETGKLTTRSSIDHICLDLASARQVSFVGAWEAGRGDGVRLSDHNGVFVDLAV